jgi:hypothetical protein
MESAVDISLDQFPPLSGAAATRRPIRLSPRARQLVIALFIWAAAALLIGGVTLHQRVAVTQADTGMCTRH